MRLSKAQISRRKKVTRSNRFDRAYKKSVMNNHFLLGSRPLKRDETLVRRIPKKQKTSSRMNPNGRQEESQPPGQVTRG